MFCCPLRSHADAEARQQAATALDDYLASDGRLQVELGRSARYILKHRYGGRDSIIKAVPETRDLFEAWAEKYPAPTRELESKLK